MNKPSSCIRWWYKLSERFEAQWIAGHVGVRRNAPMVRSRKHGK
jgi:hypothetical protein